MADRQVPVYQRRIGTQAFHAPPVAFESISQPFELVPVGFEPDPEDPDFRPLLCVLIHPYHPPFGLI
jgi:hypothetical protein